MRLAEKCSASRSFWERQIGSRHREDSDRFYRLKAREHAALLSEADRSSGIVDIGCGAGELLAYFARHAKVEAAIDYSESMLTRARERLAAYGIDLVHEGDVCTRMATAPQRVWTACGSVNQYLDERAQRKLLQVFAANRAARALYYFDCVDPVRYAVRGLGCDYSAVRRPSLKAVVSCMVRVGTETVSGRLFARARWLGSAAMGWGYLPIFWREECSALKLHVEFASSALYEYRYHVAVRKDG